MSTTFERYRGISQGRVAPTGVTPPDGSHVFVLGEDEPTEPVETGTGDFTEVKQIVDLTAYDFVKATMDTIGRETGESIPPPTWYDESAELFKFYFDKPIEISTNEVAPGGFPAGFPLESVGPIIYPKETYTGAGTFCRGVALGTSVMTHLTGKHTPPVDTPLTDLDEYTLQLFVNFDFDNMPNSWGHDFTMMKFIGVSGPNTYGILFEMYGLAGAGSHQWYPYLTHFNGTSFSGITLDNLYMVGTNPGWQLFTITYDHGLTPAQRVKFYLNSTYLGVPSFSMITKPAIPPADSEDIRYGHKKFWGQFDACRLLNRVLDAGEVEGSYKDMTIPSPAVGVQWAQQIRIDGQLYAERVIQENEERRWTDFIAPVRRLEGPHEVAFRMELQEAS